MRDDQKPSPMAGRRRTLKGLPGGLSAAGRAKFRRREGARLVRTQPSELTPAEMRRKGRRSTRAYGRKTLPQRYQRSKSR